MRTEPLESDQPEPALRQYLDVVRRRKWIVIGVFVACIAAAAVVSTLQEKTYRATIRLVVGQGTGIVVAGQASAIQPLTATMAKLVKTKIVAENVIGNLRLPAETTAEDLLDDMSVSIDPETAVLDVSVTDNERDRAVRIAQEIGLVFSALVRERFGGVTGTDAPAPGGVSELPVIVTIFDPAKPDEYPVSPRPVRNIGVAAILGLILGLLAAFLRDHFDRVLRTREEVERAFGVPVIGQVPFQKMRRRDQRAVVWSESGEIAEAFRALRANLQYVAVKRPLQTILITSASAEQGKTTVTANLALAIARSGASTAVVEGDLRRPRLDEAFDVADHGPGLTSVLVGEMPVDQATRRVGAGDGRTGVRGEIAVMPSGPLPPNPSELLSSFQMRDLLEQLTRRYDYTLIDSPPLLAVADALELARMVDGVVLAVRRNRATTDEARELRALVERLDIHVVGVVFTDVPSSGGYGYGESERRAQLQAQADDKAARAAGTPPAPVAPTPGRSTPELAGEPVTVPTPPRHAPAGRDDF